VIAVGLGGFAVYQLKAALSQVDLLRQQVDLLADQVKLQRDDLALQREAIAAEAERNRKRDELLDGQLEELRRRQRALDRQQANRIRVEWDQSGPPPGVEVEQGDAVHVALVINKSPRPIREVRAGMSLHNEKYRHASSIRPILGDAPAPAYEVQDYRVDVVQADEGYAFVFPFSVRKAARLAVRFVDDEGREWQVEDDYSVREYDPDEWMT